jgi:tyrosinase
LDAEPQNEKSTRAFDSEIFQSDTGFSGNSYPVAVPPEQNRLNITGNTGGGCVMNRPFAPPHFTVNMPTPHCSKRDFVAWIINRFADSNLVEEVLAQLDYTSIARTAEKKQSFDPPNIHASGHFGIGGILGAMGNAAESPGGECFLLIPSHVGPSVTIKFRLNTY